MARPIFCATHPRACSTAFERVFMTRKDITCVHEPFGDAFYYGPERMSARYERDTETRKSSGFSDSTYKTIFDRLDRESSEGKRVFIKDITHYLVPPENQPARIAPSLEPKKRGIGTQNTANGINGINRVNGVNGINGVNGVNRIYGVNGVNGINGVNGVSGVNGAHGAHPANGINGHNGVNGVNGVDDKVPFPYPTVNEPGNPTIVPKALLEQFHFTFLIRDPHSSIPSYYRCTIPPLDDVTGFHEFYPNEAGYDELRRFFDYTREAGLVGSKRASLENGVANGDSGKPEICVIDADDLLDDPEGVLRVYCKSVGLDFNTNMLTWDNEEDHERAKAAFEKWKGFHEDAIGSTDLKPRTHKKSAKSEVQWDAEWKEKYGEKAAKVIRETVDKNMEDFLYLKQFALTA